MTMTKEGARAPETVLAAIEDDLRRDELIWKRVHRDLRALGAPRPRRTWRLVAAAVAALALIAGSFVVGRTTAPTPAPMVVVAEPATPFTATGLESKREGFAARYGDVWGWGPAVTETTAPDEGTVNRPAASRPKWGQAPTAAPGDAGGSSLESKQEGLAARGVVGSH
jgi:hypothetical protein